MCTRMPRPLNHVIGVGARPLNHVIGVGALPLNHVIGVAKCMFRLEYWSR